MAAPTTTELLWGTQQRPKRGPKPTLSLERIVAEAVALADADGLTNLSMARLAERLGCAKMALYRYVPGKGELTALMLDTAMGTPPEPGPADAPEPWRDYLRLWAVTLFNRIWVHPWSIELSIGVHVMGPNEMDWLEKALGTLADTGLTASERFDTVVLLIGHVRSLIQQVGTADSSDAENRLQQEMAKILTEHGERYPHVAATLAEAASAPVGDGGRDNALHFGIDRILDGLGTLIAERK